MDFEVRLFITQRNLLLIILRNVCFILYRAKPVADVVQLVAASSDLPEHKLAIPYPVLQIVVAVAVMSASKNNNALSGVSVIVNYTACVLKQLFTHVPVSTKDLISSPCTALQSSLPTHYNCIASADKFQKKESIAVKEWYAFVSTFIIFVQLLIFPFLFVQDDTHSNILLRRPITWE